eukprot:TRINITY_DN4746_c0_g1_i2.p1 TRINITY_DN4746_c0_g1~~TRINITY_DN4746_c0_g1_i2.p1  ORF type:complete len:450 (+),score=50.79 TRINITY_DN4746_c0_g1_i2:164-1513(+)
MCIRDSQEFSGLDGPHFRIGGNSADYSLWNPGMNTTTPAGWRGFWRDNQLYPIGQADIAAYRRFLEAAPSAKVVIDVNFQHFGLDPNLVVPHVQAVVEAVGWDRVAGIEVGNEINAYAIQSHLRPPNWTMADFDAEFGRYFEALSMSVDPRAAGRKVNGLSLYDWDETPSFRAGVPRYMELYGDMINRVNYHVYGVNDCHPDTAPITIQDLLADSAAADLAKGLEPLVRLSREGYDREFYIGEANSGPCGQWKGSGRYGDLLWGLDYMMQMASINVSQIFFHGGSRGCTYSPLAYSSRALDAPPIVQPMYYAMYIITEFTRGAAEVYELEVDTPNAFIKTFGVKTATQWRVLVVHKDYTGTAIAATVAIRAPAAIKWKSMARVSRVSNTSPEGVYARNGIRYGGITFDNSTDGAPVGTRVYETVIQGSNQAWECVVAPITAVVFEFDSM